MPMQTTDWIWMNGSWVAWNDAKIHILSHVCHYGTSVFEGIRCYERTDGPAIFRLEEHVRRLVDSAKVYRMESRFSAEQLSRVCVEAVSRNGLTSCYIRPLIYRGYENLGVNPLGSPVEVAIAAYPWGRYLGPESQEKGVAVQVSTWNRMAPNTFPGMAKAGGHYMNAQLIKAEAITNGYVEGIALDVNGWISEGSGENVFLVYRGELYTSPLAASILGGITRDTVITLARDMGLGVREEFMPREMLYLADEAFFSGTAVEITPVTSVDRIPVGDGQRGPVTRRIQEMFFDLMTGRAQDTRGWFTPVRAGAPAAAPAAGPAKR
jgi:branched-chain amino acid aminotransferase